MIYLVLQTTEKGGCKQFEGYAYRLKVEMRKNKAIISDT
jgi:hypothetical protein